MTYRIGVTSLVLVFIFSMAIIGCAAEQNQTVEKHMAAEEAGEDEQAVVAEEAGESGASKNESGLSIYTSLYPLYDFATKVAGDQARVVNLIPPGQEPHHYEPTVSDIKNLHEADVFIYNGGNFESWIEDILEAVDNEDWVVVDSTEHLDLSTHDHGGYDAHNEHDHDGYDAHADSGHDHGGLDPHVWMDPLLAERQAEAIKDALVAADPENKEDYERNFAALAEKFAQVDEAFREMSDDIERRDFVVSHAAFTHLAERYDLNQVSITGSSPSNEPSPKQIEGLVQWIEEQGIEYIFFENQVRPNVVEIVKEEAGVDALVLHNIEVITEEEIAQGEDYFSLMNHNLEVLKQALGYNHDDETR